MSNNLFDFKIIRCPHCKKSLTNTHNSNGAAILSCQCFDYPFIGGILYLKKDKLSSKAVKLIKEGKLGSALKTLINVRFILSLPIRLFLLTKLPIHFNHLLFIFQIFSYNKSWSKYLLERQEDPSFKLSIFSTKSIKRDDKVLDVGCGVGQLFPYISLKCKGENIYGIDFSFLSLLMARRFFADNKIVLICADIEAGIPFNDRFLSVVITADSFHNLSQKYFYLKEVSRTLYGKGLLFIIHTINGSKIVYGNIKAVRPKTIFTMLKKLKFKNINIFPDSDIAYTTIATKGNNIKDVWS